MTRFLFFLFWVLLIAAGLTAFEAHRFLSTPASAPGREFVFTVEPGATFDRVAWDLKKAGAVSDVFRFRLLAWSQDAMGRIRAGEYLMNTGWTPPQVLEQLTKGRSLLYRLSVREGLTWWETAKAVEEQGFATFEHFKSVIHDPEFLRQHHIPFANAEGFLFPETYLLSKPRSPLDREQAWAVASAMVSMFWKKSDHLWKTLPLKESEGQSASPSGAMASPPVEGGTGNGTKNGNGTEKENGNGTARAKAPADVAENREARSGAAANGTARAAAARNGAAANGSLQNVQTNATAQTQGGARAKSPANGLAANGSSQNGQTNATAPATDGATARVPSSPAEIDPQALRRLVILASLVEKETGVPAERGLVAGVYANRLRLGMLLQCDPTIIYGIGESFSGSIRRSQLDDAKNLYNTYQHAGLPPGPISSPGLDSLKAAAHPAKHDFLYFVATGQGGGHTFSKSLNEHNRAVQVYRQRLKEQ